MTADAPGTDISFAASYRDWLTDTFEGTGYSILFDHLQNTEFSWLVPRDEHRAMDGQNLRMRSDLGPHPEGWFDMPCSFLEMVGALSYSIEDAIMYDPDAGDRAPEWFWMILTNLGLHICSDRWFGQEGSSGLSYVDNIVLRVMERTYDPDGTGGMFPLRYPEEDQRTVEIWYQANSYMIENFIN